VTRPHNRLIHVDNPVAQGLMVEQEAFEAIFKHVDMHEGVAAFLEKRSPNFSR